LLNLAVAGDEVVIPDARPALVVHPMPGNSLGSDGGHNGCVVDDNPINLT